MPVEPGHDAKLPKLARHGTDVRFEGVRFKYPGAERWAIGEQGGVTFAVEFGKTVAFVGPNGCGKTTLLSLIPRLFDPDEGTVRVDGRDIREVSVRSLREQIGVVTQDTVLFTGTIAENIAYGASGVTDEKIRDAARRARAEEFILAKPGGYEFTIGEGGSGLSGGQKQRLAIARAILRDPAILILDEATSMIDAESEAKIAEAIAEFVSKGEGGGGKAEVAKTNGTHAGVRAPSGGGNGRTCLIVAHRLSTVIAADAIVVMDGGAIADVGTHAELLGRCGIYQSLVANQLVLKPVEDPKKFTTESTEGTEKKQKQG
jgi:ABC-type multidrug transport system fused ATPase/permease subunit